MRETSGSKMLRFSSALNAFTSSSEIEIYKYWTLIHYLSSLTYSYGENALIYKASYPQNSHVSEVFKLYYNFAYFR